MFISEIKGSVLAYTVKNKKMSCLFLLHPTCLEYRGIYYTNTGSNQITGSYWSHKTTLYDNTSSITYLITTTTLPEDIHTDNPRKDTVTASDTKGIHDFIKCCFISWVHLDLRPDNILLVKLQPIILHHLQFYFC